MRTILTEKDIQKDDEAFRACFDIVNGIKIDFKSDVGDETRPHVLEKHLDSTITKEKIEIKKSKI